MKGIVFNLLEQSVVADHGEDMWDDLLDAANLDGAYTSLGSYPDEDLLRLRDTAAEALGCSPADVERWLGQSAIGRLAQLYPEFFEPHTSTKAFVLTLNDIIHPEVRKLYPGADVPVFEFESRSPQQLTLRYRSHRKMCAFAEGLIRGTADHYGESVSIDHVSCMLQEAAECRLDCTFERGGDHG
ncbi:MAG: heme NO-binding domain-containing protein [Deltaproteobacteria bacterium]|nr:heme NO-binding domain-containing protein [Deltaproteobacteria bacterium]